MVMVFLLFSLIQERQFLVISESIYTLDYFVLVNRLEGISGAGLVVHLIASPGMIDRESANQIVLLHVRDSRNPKPTLA